MMCNSNFSSSKYHSRISSVFFSAIGGVKIGVQRGATSTLERFGQGNKLDQIASAVKAIISWSMVASGGRRLGLS